MPKHFKAVQVEDYEPYIGAEAVERILKKAKALNHLHVTNINSTYYGGGVAELLESMTILMNNVGIRTGWRTITGSPDFFGITKKMHNALQGGDIHLTKRKLELYEEIVYENSIRNHLEHDIVIVHDPQPIPMIRHYLKRKNWFWRCHIEFSNPSKKLWRYLIPFVEQFDAAIFSIHEYGKNLKIPQYFFMPAINPFTIKNKKLSEKEVTERLTHYKIPLDLPLIVQVSRFDRWKDPEGVIQAFKIARKEVKATLVLLGNVATDDPEGMDVFESLLSQQEERIIIMSQEDTSLVNALQHKAAVVIQKSIKEGFGLTVTEAMWKGTPVIGGRTGGIPYQIEDGFNGYLVSSVEETAERIVELLKNPKLRNKMGKRAKQSVKDRFLQSRLLEQYLDLFHDFKCPYHKLS